MITTTQTVKAEARNLSFYYNGGNHAVKNVSMPLYENKITALIGPSGCGKSTYLRCFNRMHDLYPGNKYEGQFKDGLKNGQGVFTFANGNKYEGEYKDDTLEEKEE